MPTTLEDFKVGQRVELHPACDLWMRGARYGDVVKIGRQYIHVYLDRTGSTITVSPANLTHAETEV